MQIIKYLQTQFPGISRSQAGHMIETGLVLVNDHKIKSKYKLNTTDRVQVDKSKLPEFIIQNSYFQFSPERTDLKVIFEDQYLLVVDKPHGIPVHGDRNHSTSLLNQISAHIIYNSPNPFAHIGLINRIDRNTTGLVLVSKDPEAHAFYTRQFRKREVQKTYLAVVCGDFQKHLQKIKKNKIEIESYISTKPHNRKYFATDSTQGELAQTEFEFLRYFDSNKKYSLISAKPHTGRTHQIRVHASELGFPILGDRVYGTEEYSQMMLFAAEIEISMFGDKSRAKFISNLTQTALH